VVGRGEIQPILTGARQRMETDVHDLMQKTLEEYGSGIQIRQVQLQKVDPPSQVIEAFRDELIRRVPGGIDPAMVSIQPVGASVGPYLGPGCVGGVVLYAR